MTKILAWNVNILGPKETQRRFIYSIKKTQANLIVLIDTQLSETLETCVKNLWGQRCYFNSLCSNSRGIAVLIKDGIDLENIQWHNIIEGNFSKLTFTFKKENYMIKCLYAPNKDSTDDNESALFFKVYLTTRWITTTSMSSLLATTTLL